MIDWLAAHGVDEVVLSCGFLASEVRAVLGDGEPGGRELHYVEEEEPLDTAGAVKFAEPLLEERFLVMNGDILADFDLTALQRFHSEHEATLTIALTPVEDPSAYGLVRTHEDGRVEAFLEKTSADQIDTNMINAGAYVLERKVLDMMEDGSAGLVRARHLPRARRLRPVRATRPRATGSTSGPPIATSRGRATFSRARSRPRSARAWATDR